MVYAGQRLENPVTGEIFEFIKTGNETNGAWFDLLWTIKPDKPLPFPHLHPALDERIEVVKGGELRVFMGNRTHVVKPDGSITIPRNTLHQAYSNTPMPLTCRVRYTPAGHIGEVLEAVCWLASHGSVNKRGVPSLLALIVLAEAHEGALHTERMTKLDPRLLNLLGFIGRSAGFRPTYG